MSEQQQTLTIQQAMDLGVQHHTAGRLPQAETIYQQILQADHDQPVALHLLGVIAHQVGKNDTAVDLIARALALKPDYAEAHSNLGLALQDLGKLDEAVSSYQKALALKPNYADAHNNLGTALQDLGKLDEAVASYRKALALKPDYAEAHSNLGITLGELGHLDEAVASYHKALAIKPDYAEAHSNLGNALKGLGRPVEAVASYQKALAIKPDYAMAHNNLGATLKDLGKLEEAVASYRKALDLKPDYTEAHSNLAVTLKALGKLEAALQIFESIDTPECYAKVLECLFALGEYDKFYEKQAASVQKNEINTRVAAINAFASHQLNRSNPDPFCPTPLNFVRVYEILDGVDDAGGFLRDLMDDLQSREAVWEPPGKTTNQGFQTAANLFDRPNGRLADLEQIIKDYIEKYRLEFSSKDCVFIRSFPKNISLTSWFVRLLKGGHQTEHIHPDGWLSGVFYLQVPKFLNESEGSIEFTLYGYDYPNHKNLPNLVYTPKVFDIALFPSSLFHRTIPFNSQEERQSIAFDLVPK